MALFIALLQSSDRNGWRWPDARDSVLRWFRSGPSRGTAAGGASAASVVAVSVLAVLLLGIAAPAARAEPDSALLNELKARLTRPPDCAPSCAEVTSAQVTARGDRLDVLLQVSALASVAVPMPTARDRWQIDSITVDGRSALALGREADGTLAVPLPVGAHEVRLSGSLPAAASLQLEFPRPPRVIAVTSEGWDVSGVNEGRLLSGSLELVRRRTATQGATLETSSEFPAFVRVMRTFYLDLDWSVSTSVSRVAPEQAAITVEVPLIAGESALSGALRTRDTPGGGRVALVGIERGQLAVSWESGLARSESLDLEVPADAARAEVWIFVVSPQWNVEFEGQPAVLPDGNSAAWGYEFHPRPGEKLHLRIARPERGCRQRRWPSTRSTSPSASASAPPTRRCSSSTAAPKAGGTRSRCRRTRGSPLCGSTENPFRCVRTTACYRSACCPEITAPKWSGRPPKARGCARKSPPSICNAPASNVQTSVSLPEDRWPLFAHGAGIGPAMLYWSELLVFIVIAALLGSWRRSPLRTHEWLLLGAWPLDAVVVRAGSWSRLALRAALAPALAGGCFVVAVQRRSGAAGACSRCRRRRARVRGRPPEPSRLAGHGRRRLAGSLRFELRVVPRPRRLGAAAPAGPLGADVGVPRADVRLGAVDRARAAALAALGVARVESERPLAREGSRRLSVRPRRYI